MTGEAFQVIGATQCADELAGQPLAALAADLPTALRLGLHLLVVLHGVGHRAHGALSAVLGCEALRPRRLVVGIEGLGGLSREAIAARVVGNVLLLLLLLLLLRRRGALTLAVYRGRRRRVHGRQRLAGDGGEGGRSSGSGQRAAVVTTARR